VFVTNIGVGDRGSAVLRATALVDAVTLAAVIAIRLLLLRRTGLLWLLVAFAQS
jgi:hypothetical protein